MRTVHNLELAKELIASFDHSHMKNKEKQARFAATPAKILLRHFGQPLIVQLARLRGCPYASRRILAGSLGDQNSL